MAVDLLTISPPEDRKETVMFGGQEVEVRGLRMTQIARLAQRFEGFRKSFFNADTEADYRGAAMLEAWPAIIVAGLGKDRSAQAPLLEQHLEKFGQAELMDLGAAIMRLTNPEALPANDNAPLPDSAAVIAEAAADPGTSSPAPPST